MLFYDFPSLFYVFPSVFFVFLSVSCLFPCFPSFSNFSLVFLLDHLSRHVQKNETYEKLKEMKIAKDRKVIPDPIDDRKFQE